MGITLSGTSGINTPGVVNTAGETIATTLAVTGATSIGGSLGVTGAATADSLQVGGVATNVYPLVSGTAQTAPPDTPEYFDFTGIPSWVKRITVMFNGVSTNGTDAYLIQLGDSGGVETSGYASAGKYFSTTSFSTATSTEGFIVGNTTVAANFYSGQFTLNELSANVWTCFGSVADDGGATNMGTGSKTLSGTLTRIRVTTIDGIDTFDAGSINIMYE